MDDFTLVTILVSIVASLLFFAILSIITFAVTSILSRFERKNAIEHIKNIVYDDAGLTQYEKAINNNIKHHAKELLDKSKKIIMEYMRYLPIYFRNTKTHLLKTPRLIRIIFIQRLELLILNVL